MSQSLENRQAVANALMEFAKRQPDFSKNVIVDKIKDSKEFRVWLKNALEIQSNRKGEEFFQQPFYMYVASSLEGKVAFTFKSSSSSKEELQFSYVDPRRQGMVVIKDLQPVRFSAHYNNDKVRFFALIKVDLECSAGKLMNESPDDFEILGSYSLYLWSKPTEIPLIILRSWMNGKQNNPKEGAILLSATNLDLGYAEGSYPLALFRLFKSLGKNAFDVMREEGALTPEIYEIITEKIEGLSNYYSSLAGGVIGQLYQHLVMEEDQFSIPETTLEALKVSGKDKQKLNIINGVNDYLSYSQWDKLLGFQGKGAAFAFFERLVGDDLVRLEKTNNGIKVNLTGKGRYVIPF